MAKQLNLFGRRKGGVPEDVPRATGDQGKIYPVARQRNEPTDDRPSINPRVLGEAFANQMRAPRDCWDNSYDPDEDD